VVTLWRQQLELAAGARRLGAGTAAGNPLPAVELSVVDVSFEAIADRELREYFQNLPTSFALGDEAVDRLRAAAAQPVRESPAFQRFVASLSHDD